MRHSAIWKRETRNSPFFRGRSGTRKGCLFVGARMRRRVAREWPGNGPSCAVVGRSGGRAMEGTGEGRKGRGEPRIHYARHCHNDRGAGSAARIPLPSLSIIIMIPALPRPFDENWSLCGRIKGCSTSSIFFFSVDISFRRYMATESSEGPFFPIERGYHEHGG